MRGLPALRGPKPIFLSSLLLRHWLFWLWRTAAAALFDAGRFELVFVRSECAVHLHVVVCGGDPLDVLFRIVRIVELFGSRPSTAERLGQSALTAASFGVRFVLAIDAKLRERDHLETRQRNFIAASRTGSVDARAETSDCCVDRAETLLGSIEQSSVCLDFRQRSR